MDLRYSKQNKYSVISDIFLMAPTLKQWSKKTDVFLQGVFIIWTMEDFLYRALSNGSPLLTREHFSDFKRFLVNIMTGMYRNTEAIPEIEIPFLNKMLHGWFHIYFELKKLVAGYDKYGTDFLRELLNWIRFYEIRALHMGIDWEPTNQPYVLLKNLGGRKIILELIHLLNATYVNEEYRDHVLFGLFRESADLIFNLVYDIVSLTRVVQGWKISRNSLFWNITRRGLSFEAAFEQHLFVINNEILDLQKAALGLEKEFASVESVQKYVRNTMLFVDGSIRYLLSQERYGKSEIKIMKVVKILHNEKDKKLCIF